MEVSIANLIDKYSEEQGGRKKADPLGAPWGYYLTVFLDYVGLDRKHSLNVLSVWNSTCCGPSSEGIEVFYKGLAIVLSVIHTP